MLKGLDQKHKRKAADYFHVLCLSFSWTSAWSRSLFILNVAGNKPLLISTSRLPILDRNLYARVPHLSQVELSTCLTDDNDWWHSVFVVIERTHKYLKIPSPSNESKSLMEYLISQSVSFSTKWAAQQWPLTCTSIAALEHNCTESIFFWFEKAAVDYSLI